MKLFYGNIDEFVNEFKENADGRENLVNELIKNSNRLSINLPKFGAARKVSNRLSKEPFSVFYEFEKKLSNQLHPLLARFKLNLVSDAIINRRFSERYASYRGEVLRVSARSKKLSLDLLQDVIVSMVKNDGHYMVTKFYDLVLRILDEDLFRSLRPIEVAIINIKKRLADDRAKNAEVVKKAFLRYRKSSINADGELFIKRISLDEHLREYAEYLHDLIDQLKSQSVETDREDSGTSVDDLPGFAGETVGIAEREAGEESPAEDSTGGGGYRHRGEAHRDDGEENDERIYPEEGLLTLTEDDLTEIDSGDSIDGGLGNGTEILDDRRDLEGYDPEPAGESNRVEMAFDDSSAQAGVEIGEEFFETLAAEGVSPEEDESPHEIVEEEKSLGADSDRASGAMEGTGRAFQGGGGISDEDVGDDGVLLHGEGIDNGDLMRFLDEKWDGLEGIKERESREVKNYGSIVREIRDDEERTRRIFSYADTLGFTENRIQILSELPEEDNYFTHLIQFLEELSWEMDVSEIKAYLDRLMDEFKGDEALMERYPFLIARMENFRDSFRDAPSELLGEVDVHLTEIKNAFLDSEKKCIGEQYNYLMSCLESERFAPMKRTIVLMIENILSQRDPLERKPFVFDEKPGMGLLQRIETETGVNPLEYPRDIILGRLGDEQTELSNYLAELSVGDIDLRGLLRDSSMPRKTKSTFQIILNSVGFTEAFHFITRSSDFTPEIKIILLDKWLRVQAEDRGWFETNRESKIARIDRMIDYYSNLVNGYKNRKAKTQSPVRHREEPGGKAVETAPDQDDKVPMDKRSRESEDVGITGEEKIYQKALTIIKTFSDNIEAVEPLFRKLSNLIPDEYLSKLDQQIYNLKRNKEGLIEGALRMLESGIPDRELVEKIGRSSPFFQFLWWQAVSKRLNIAKLEESFKVFEDNENFFNELNRIAKIIKINNKDNLLQRKLDGENELIKKIAQNLSVDALRRLWIATSSRQNKEKIKLFREFSDLAGALEIMEKKKVKTEKAEAADSAELGKETAMAGGENRRAATESGEKPPGTAQGKDPAIQQILDELESFQNLYRVPKFRKLSEKRVPAINRFLADLAAGEKDAVYLVENHRSEFIGFLRYIISEHPELKAVFSTAPAVRFCKSKGIL